MRLDWGTVPTWVSAILTGSSLLLGFYILLRDRRKEERQEALKVVCWREVRYEERVQDVRLLNTSDRPIYHPQVLVNGSRRSTFRQDFELYAGFKEEPVIRPGEEASLTVPTRNGPGVGRLVSDCVYFRDADGIFWSRDLSDGELRRVAKARPWRRVYKHPPGLSPSHLRSEMSADG